MNCSRDFFTFFTKVSQLLVLLVTMLSISYSQSETCKYVELYDQLYHNLVEQRYKVLDTNNKRKSDVYGDGMSYAMVADLIMFETTHDEKYLNRYLTHSAAILNYRKDRLDSNDNPRWSNHPSMYQDGLILWSYAYFIDAVMVKKSIDENVQIPISAAPFLEIFEAKPKTIRELVPLYYSELLTTLSYYEKFWYGPKVGLKIYAERGARPASLNFQSAFGATYYYLGTAMNNSSFIQKAHEFALLHRSTVRDMPNCIFGTPVPPFSKRKVLEITDDSCLVFMHWGWRPSKCKRDFEANWYDDISHAIQSLIFPISVHNRFKSENGSYYFSDNDMILLHNTFTKRIFAGYNQSCPEFNNTIIGDSIVRFAHYLSGFNTLAIRSISYSFLIPYDDNPRTSGLKINKILKDFLETECFKTVVPLLAGMDLFGLAMFIRENQKLSIH